MIDKTNNLHKSPGPLLLLAGPGTGKTYRLAKRIKYLVEDRNISPSNITVITFTAAAARNMHERISDFSSLDTYVNVDKHPERICTMHSLGHRIIREKAKELGFKDIIYVLYSDKIREIIVEDAAQVAGFSREDGYEAARCRQMGKCSPAETKKCKICELYQKIIRKCSAVDHDDQILLACKLLKENADLLSKYRDFCQHLLVDEYQDINAGQFELINLLTEGHREGLFVVGDDYQSIYSWRGGSPEFIRSFNKHFGNGAKTEPLLKSFRCHRNILEGAMAVVAGFDKEGLAKGKFDYEKPDGSKIVIHNTASDEKEAKIVLNIIQRALSTKSILVLIPNKYFSVALVQALRNANIKYTAPLKLPGEGLPLISIFSRWLRDSNDSIALRECIDAFIESPTSGIPSSKVRKPEKIKQRDDALLSISRLWSNVLDGKANNLWESMKLAKKQDGLCKDIYNVLEELFNIAKTDKDPAAFSAKLIDKLAPWKKVSSMLEEVDLWVETSGRMDNISQGEGIELMTFQNAKGLEADIVCVIGLEDGIMPQNSTNTERLAEQSRLMFVSMTRAKEELHLFHARNRSASVMLRQLHSKGKSPDIRPSRFLDSIANGNKEVIYHKA